MIKKLLKLGLWTSLAMATVISLTLIVNSHVVNSTKSRVFSNVTDIPHNEVGLLLGTTKTLKNGYTNVYYTYRLDATVKLFKAGKIDAVLVSGDNSRSSYDEPTTFKDDLIARGIPAGKIHLDYAGFRTLDSVVRFKEVFGQSSTTVISQRFHVERALYLAESKGLTAVGFTARDASMKYGWKIRLREYAARMKMMLDLTFDVGPKFLGPKETIAI